VVFLDLGRWVPQLETSRQLVPLPNVPHDVGVRLQHGRDGRGFHVFPAFVSPRVVAVMPSWKRPRRVTVETCSWMNEGCVFLVFIGFFIFGIGAKYVYVNGLRARTRSFFTKRRRLKKEE
jgi:hypothetical protein